MLVPPAQFSQACQDPSGFAFVEGDLSSLEESSLGTPHAIRPGPYLSPMLWFDESQDLFGMWC